MKMRFLTRTIWLVSLVSLFTDVASEMLYPVMPVYLRSIGFSVLLIGILEGIAEATAGLSKGYFGNLSDKMGRRLPFVQWGYGLSAISKPLLAAFVFPLWVFFARTLDRFGKGIRTSARDAMLSDESTPENKGKVFGFHRGLDTVGAAIGPAAALIFLYFYPGEYVLMFVLAFIPGLLSIGLTLFIKEKRRLTGNGKQRPGFLEYLSYWKRASKNFRILVPALLFFAFFNSSDAFLLLAVKNKGFSDTTMIGMYMFYNLVYALFAFPAGMLADRIGLKKILSLGMLVFAIVYFFMGFVTSLMMTGALFLLYGIYAASTESISKAMISNMAQKEDTATAIGFYNSLSSICALLASSFAGFLWYASGPKTMFIFSASGALIVAAYVWFFKNEDT